VVAFVLAALIVAGVAYLTFSGADQVDRESTQRPEPGFSMSQN
jgi:hypothetical protein